MIVNEVKTKSETRYTIENECGKFTIIKFGDRYSVYGNKGAAKHEFKKIHKMPPNEYGNFYGREKAGFEACEKIINNHKKER